MKRRLPLALLVTFAACAPGTTTDAPIDDLGAPDRATFAPVADALQVGCGTLDCHGQVGRNLRLFGARGLRLQEGDTSASGATTPAEYAATFWSVVGLEPEVMNLVVAQKGRRPERLALIRKGRGREPHKGGTLMRPNDDLDRCIVSWIAGGTDELACATVTDRPRPALGP